MKENIKIKSPHPKIQTTMSESKFLKYKTILENEIQSGKKQILNFYAKKGLIFKFKRFQDITKKNLYQILYLMKEDGKKRNKINFFKEFIYMELNGKK